MRPLHILSQRAPYLLSTAFVTLAALFAIGDPFDKPRASLSFSLIILTLGGLLLAWVPASMATVLFMLVAVASALAPPEIVFAGFHSSALWLVVGGMLISHALTTSGIDRRLADLLDALPGGSYPRALFAAMLLGAALVVLMPSAIGRVVIVLPIAAAFAMRLGFARGDSGYNGIVAVAVCATVLPAFSILPANYPNLVIAGIAENLFDLHISYGEWLLMHFPVFGALKLAMVIVACYLLFPARLPAVGRTPAPQGVPWGWEQLTVAVVLALAVLLWATDERHGIAAGWIGLAAGAACFLPRIGAVAPSEFAKAIDVGPVFMVAGLLAIGSVAADTGLAVELARSLTHAVPAGVEGAWPVYMALALINFVVQLVTTNAALPAVMLPQSAALAEAMDVELQLVVAAHITGYANLPLPHLAAPTLYALHRSGVPRKRFLGLILILALVTAAILWPLQYLWLSLIDFI